MTPPYTLWLRRGLPREKIDLTERPTRSQFHTCLTHGWDALNTPCPKCNPPKPEEPK